MSKNPPKWEPPNYDVGLYILKYRKPVKCKGVLKWGKWYERNPRHVRSTTVGKVWVSTVFLGVDHNHTHKGKPVLFETMIFPEQEYQTRCCTWREALKMHWQAVEEVKNEV